MLILGVATAVFGLLLMEVPFGASQYEACGCLQGGRPIYGKREIKNLPKGNWTNAIPLNYTQTGNHSLFDGDMLFDNKDKAIFKGYRAAEVTSKRWPNGRVYYKLDGIHPTYHPLIHASLHKLTQATHGCVSFQMVPYHYQGPHVMVVDKGGCYSSVGRTSPYGQELSLGAQGCMLEGTIQHEFMHALGFYHEQSRPDRDQFINVDFRYIQRQTCNNFERCQGCTMHTPYDTKSIMQYAGDSFACIPQAVTMSLKDGTPIPWNHYLTDLDVQKIRSYYECRGSGPSQVQSPH